MIGTLKLNEKIFTIEHQGMVFSGWVKNRFFSSIEINIENSIGNKALCAEQI